MATTNLKVLNPGDQFVDFAQPLTPALAKAFAAAGVQGVMQYVRYDNTDRPKYGSAAEAQIAHDFGLGYMQNWEIQSNRALFGYDTGHSDGQRARDELRSQGYPEEVSAPVSVDMNTLYGNATQVSGFVKGYWEMDGDLCPNIAYLDTDGGRLMASMGVSAELWIPGAFYWSPELYAVSTRMKNYSQQERYDAITALAKQNPQAVAIQFPSTIAFGIGVDFSTVLKPITTWGPTITVADPQPDPPIIVTTPIETTPSQEANMANVHITFSDAYAELWATAPLTPAGDPDILLVAWAGPGGDKYAGFQQRHGANHPIELVRTVAACADWIFVGNLSKVEDSKHTWTGDEFQAVTG